MRCFARKNRRRRTQEEEAQEGGSSSSSTSTTTEEPTTTTTATATTMPTVTRDGVLTSCATTSVSLLGIGLGARALSGVVPVSALHGDWNAALPLASGDASDMLVAACAAAGAVTLGRIALLQVWEEFAASTDRSNAQVLNVLEGPLDVAQVAVLPAIGEEVLFRGALLPAIGGVPGVAVSSIIFGALHIGGGRSAAFGVWASMVGACYGACALQTGSVAAPAAAHAMANLASAAYWMATRGEEKTD